MAESNPKPTARRPRSGGVVVPSKPRWHQRLAGFAVYSLIQTVAATIRFRLDDPHGLLNRGNVPEPAIFSIWHNRLSLCLVVYHRHVQRRQPHRRMAAIVSASKDGAFLSRILELFRVQPVRGSSSRRGPQALRELITWGEQGFDLAITPDGPRGPRYEVQDGVTSVAQVTGLPVLPVCYDLKWKLQLGSWDRFQIPLPFSVCTVRVGELLRVPREASDEERDALRRELEKRMRVLTID